MAQGDALMRALGQPTRRNIEPGVRGLELRFQQNRRFGAGPIRPYIGPPPLSRQSPLRGLRGGVRAGR